MTQEKLTNRLNDLIQLDVDAVRAYDEAIEACDRGFIREKLTEFKKDHQQHIEVLSAEVTRLGGIPRVERDFKGFLIEGFTSIVARGDASALYAMRVNEELTSRTYEAACDERMPEAIEDTVRKNRDDERRHLEWIKTAIDQKVWKRAA